MPGTSDRYIAPKTGQRHSLRSSLLLLLLIPALALAGLWGGAAGVLVADSSRLQDDADLAASVGRTTHTLLVRLQEERRVTAAWQAAPGSSFRDELNAARSETDQEITDAITTFRTARSALDSASPAVQDAGDGLHQGLEKITEQRAAIDERALDRSKAFRYYSDTIAEGAGLLKATLRSDGEPLGPGTGAVTSLVQLSEMISREDALLSGALASGQMSPAARDQFARYVAVQRQYGNDLATEDLPADAAASYEGLIAGEQWSRLVLTEDAVTTDPQALPEQESTWRDAADAVGAELRDVRAESLDTVVRKAGDRSDELLLTAVIGTVLALVALAATGVLALRFSRSVTGRITRLQQSTVDLADHELPRFVEQLGERDLGKREEPGPADHPDGEDHTRDEVGRLAAATRHLQWTVQNTLVQQARGREGTEQVFLGLARRTQVLIGRLIPKLDELERKHQDSDLLKDIFAVDHLATRVRRHTENLVILGGSPPVRRWTKAVPIYEVLRSAISETEDYRRVEAQPAPQVSLIGPAVADVVHLLAELIENGTSFSPPDTTVSVSATTVARGLALEVEDRGLGMPEERYDHINKLLTEPPKLDMLTLGETPRLGHFVVARLARRHNLEVSLRRSPYGGTLAIVLLPSALLEKKTTSLLETITEQAQNSQSAEPAARERRVEQQAADAIAAAISREDGLYDGPPPAHEPQQQPVIPAQRQDQDELVSPLPQVQSATADLGAQLASSPALDDYSGYPSYGGAGLLPSEPSHGSAEEPQASAGSTHPAESHPVQAHPAESYSAESYGAQAYSAASYGAGTYGAGTYGGAQPHGAEPYSGAGTYGGEGHRAEEHSAEGHFAEGGAGAHTGYTMAAGNDTGYATPAGNDMSQDPPAEVTTPSTLPTRVRGESLAEPLRKAMQSGAEQVDPGGAPPAPDRAGAAAAAIQAANRRARREAEPAAPAGDQDSRAETRGHGAGPDDR